MLSRKEVKTIIKSKIRTDENIGQLAGGSGHLSHTSFSITDFTVNSSSEGSTKVYYEYVFSVESEFTHYPDNPPREYQYSKFIVLDNNHKIVSESPKQLITGTGFNY